MMSDQSHASQPPGESRRHLPAVSALLATPYMSELFATYTRPLVVEAIQATLADYRQQLAHGQNPPNQEAILDQVRNVLRRQQASRLRSVVNATGIILHTGLGRAVLPQKAVDALAGLNRCCNLQIDLETGLRGKRNDMCAKLLCRLTGAEAALLVNNNAAATYLLLAALCPNQEVIISRGQLIEIGGSFRLPDCIHQSGAKMVEVGTTNKTHLRDYEQALNERTRLILRVNPSNYRVVGFSKEVPIADLVTLKKKHPVLVVDDLGCGALINLEQYGLPKEPTVQESIAAGADLVCFSGDKLIGGPQCGIILGRKDLVDVLKKHPLSRMLRVGKLTDMALEQTLRLFLEPETLLQHHPTLRMLATPAEELKRRATHMKQMLDQANVALGTRVVAGESATGGGSLPATPLTTFLLAISSSKQKPDEISRFLRQNEPPIIARIAHDEVQLDLRTLMPGEEAIVLEALKRLNLQNTP